MSACRHSGNPFSTYNDNHTRNIYTVSQKRSTPKVIMITFSILNGFSKFFHRWKVNFQQNPYNTYHHTFSMLLHYLVKVRSSNLWQFPKKQSKNCVTFDKNWNVSCHMAEYCHNSCSKCPPFARTHAERCTVHATRQLHCQWWWPGQCHDIQKTLLQFTTPV